MAERDLSKTVLILFVVVPLLMVSGTGLAEEPVRVGVIGFDSYQAVAFTQLFHNPPEDNPALRGLRVVAAWTGPSSPDIEESVRNLPKWRESFIAIGVPIKMSIDEVLQEVDVAMVMTLDGRNHLELVTPVLRAKKPVYIGRPMAASFEDVLEIFQLAEKYGTPVFSCSQHRFSPGFIDMRDHEEVGTVLGCSVYGGCPTVPHHPELFWHGIHGFETLYTIMGPGVVNVRRASTRDAELITCVWGDGRIGTYRGIRKGVITYSALVFGDKGIVPAGVYGQPAPIKGVVPKSRYKGYEGVATAMARFYKTRKLPVSPTETIELFGAMEAAHESKRRGGAPVSVSEVIALARKRLADRKTKSGR